MILSTKWKYLFIKSRKVGGTSVEITLSRHCGHSDIVTPITPIDEYLRLESGGHCRNYSKDKEFERQYLDRLRATKGRLNIIPRWITKTQRFFNHMSYHQVLDEVGYPLDDYYCFTVERHPYDKALSLANHEILRTAYRTGTELQADMTQVLATLDQLIENGGIRMIRNFDLYSLNGKSMMDRILRQEVLEHDLQEAFKDLGIDASVSLLVTKEGKRDKSKPAREILSPAQKVIIQRLCQEEFELMGYVL